MSKQEEKLQRILGDLQELGYIKEVPSKALKMAIMRQVGFSEATVKQYKTALEAMGVMKPNKAGTVWVIL